MTRFSRSARLVVAITLAGGVIALSACSAGKITQTSTQVAAVPGASADLGPIALRDLTVAYAGTTGYPKGGNAPLVVRIFNNGPTTVNVVSAASNRAASVTVVAGGQATTTASVATITMTATTTGSPTPTSTARPTASASASAARPTTTATPTPTPAPTERAGQGFPIPITAGSYALLVPGQGRYLQLQGLTEALYPGMSVEVTFTFDNGKSATLSVPFGLPTEPGPRQTPEPEHAE